MWYKNKPLHRGSHCHCQPSSLWRNSLQRFKYFEVLFFLLCRQSRLSLIELTMLCIFFMSVGWSPIFSSPPVFFNIPRGYFLVKKCERTAHKKALFFLSWRQRRRPTPLPLRRKNLQTSERNSDAEGERFFFGFYNRIQTFLTPYSSRLNLTQVNCTELFSTA